MEERRPLVLVTVITPNCICTDGMKVEVKASRGKRRFMDGKGGRVGGTIVGYGGYVQRVVCACMKIALRSNAYIF